MPWHGKYPTNVRWRETGFEMRCPDCMARGYSPYWWPLDQEFWDIRRGLQRCRACWLAKKRYDERERNRLNPRYRFERDLAYRTKNREVLRAKRRERDRKAKMAAQDEQRLAARAGRDGRSGAGPADGRAVQGGDG